MAYAEGKADFTFIVKSEGAEEARAQAEALDKAIDHLRSSASAPIKLNIDLSKGAETILKNNKGLLNAYVKAGKTLGEGLEEGLRKGLEGDKKKNTLSDKVKANQKDALKVINDDLKKNKSKLKESDKFFDDQIESANKRTQEITQAYKEFEKLGADSSKRDEAIQFGEQLLGNLDSSVEEYGDEIWKHADKAKRELDGTRSAVVEMLNEWHYEKTGTPQKDQLSGEAFSTQLASEEMEAAVAQQKKAFNDQRKASQEATKQQAEIRKQTESVIKERENLKKKVQEATSADEIQSLMNDNGYGDWKAKSTSSGNNKKNQVVDNLDNVINNAENELERIKSKKDRLEVLKRDTNDYQKDLDNLWKDYQKQVDIHGKGKVDNEDKLLDSAKQFQGAWGAYSQELDIPDDVFDSYADKFDEIESFLSESNLVYDSLDEFDKDVAKIQDSRQKDLRTKNTDFETKFKEIEDAQNGLQKIASVAKDTKKAVSELESDDGLGTVVSKFQDDLASIGDAGKNLARGYDTKSISDSMNSIMDDFSGTETKTISIDVNPPISGVLDDLMELRSQLNNLSNEKIKIKVDLDADKVQQQIDKLTKKADTTAAKETAKEAVDLVTGEGTKETAKAPEGKVTVDSNIPELESALKDLHGNVIFDDNIEEIKAKLKDITGNIKFTSDVDDIISRIEAARGTLEEASTVKGANLDTTLKTDGDSVQTNTKKTVKSLEDSKAEIETALKGFTEVQKNLQPSKILQKGMASNALNSAIPFLDSLEANKDQLDQLADEYPDLAEKWQKKKEAAIQAINWASEAKKFDGKDKKGFAKNLLSASTEEFSDPELVNRWRDQIVKSQQEAQKKAAKTQKKTKAKASAEEQNASGLRLSGELTKGDNNFAINVTANGVDAARESLASLTSVIAQVREAANNPIRLDLSLSNDAKDLFGSGGKALKQVEESGGKLANSFSRGMANAVGKTGESKKAAQGASLVDSYLEREKTRANELQSDLKKLSLEQIDKRSNSLEKDANKLNESLESLQEGSLIGSQEGKKARSSAEKFLAQFDSYSKEELREIREQYPQKYKALQDARTKAIKTLNQQEAVRTGSDINAVPTDSLLSESVAEKIQERAQQTKLKRDSLKNNLRAVAKQEAMEAELAVKKANQTVAQQTKKRLENSQSDFETTGILKDFASSLDLPQKDIDNSVKKVGADLNNNLMDAVSSYKAGSAPNGDLSDFYSKMMTVPEGSTKPVADSLLKNYEKLSKMNDRDLSSVVKKLQTADPERFKDLTTNQLKQTRSVMGDMANTFANTYTEGLTGLDESTIQAINDYQPKFQKQYNKMFEQGEALFNPDLSKNLGGGDLSKQFNNIVNGANEITAPEIEIKVKVSDEEATSAIEKIKSSLESLNTGENKINFDVSGLDEATNKIDTFKTKLDELSQQQAKAIETETAEKSKDVDVDATPDIATATADKITATSGEISGSVTATDIKADSGDVASVKASTLEVTDKEISVNAMISSIQESTAQTVQLIGEITSLLVKSADPVQVKAEATSLEVKDQETVKVKAEASDIDAQDQGVVKVKAQATDVEVADTATAKIKAEATEVTVTDSTESVKIKGELTDLSVADGVTVKVKAEATDIEVNNEGKEPIKVKAEAEIDGNKVSEEAKGTPANVTLDTNIEQIQAQLNSMTGKVTFETNIKDIQKQLKNMKGKISGDSSEETSGKKKSAKKAEAQPTELSKESVKDLSDSVTKSVDKSTEKVAGEITQTVKEQIEPAKITKTETEAPTKNELVPVGQIDKLNTVESKKATQEISKALDAVPAVLGETNETLFRKLAQKEESSSPLSFLMSRNPNIQDNILDLVNRRKGSFDSNTKQAVTETLSQMPDALANLKFGTNQDLLRKFAHNSTESPLSFLLGQNSDARKSISDFIRQQAGVPDGKELVKTTLSEIPNFVNIQGVAGRTNNLTKANQKSFTTQGMIDEFVENISSRSNLSNSSSDKNRSAKTSQEDGITIYSQLAKQQEAREKRQERREQQYRQSESSSSQNAEFNNGRAKRDTPFESIFEGTDKRLNKVFDSVEDATSEYTSRRQKEMKEDLARRLGSGQYLPSSEYDTLYKDMSKKLLELDDLYNAGRTFKDPAVKGLQGEINSTYKKRLKELDSQYGLGKNEAALNAITPEKAASYFGFDMLNDPANARAGATKMLAKSIEEVGETAQSMVVKNLRNDNANVLYSSSAGDVRSNMGYKMYLGEDGQARYAITQKNPVVSEHKLFTPADFPAFQDRAKAALQSIQDRYADSDKYLDSAVLNDALDEHDNILSNLFSEVSQAGITKEQADKALARVSRAREKEFAGITENLERKGYIGDVDEDFFEQLSGKRGKERSKYLNDTLRAKFDGLDDEYKKLKVLSERDDGVIVERSTYDGRSTINKVSFDPYVNANGEEVLAMRNKQVGSDMPQSAMKNWGQNVVNKFKSLTEYLAGMFLADQAMQEVMSGIQFVSDSDKAMTNIAMTMNATDSQLQNLKTQSIEVGKTLKTDATNVIEAATLYANANETADSILAKATPTIMLSNASGASASESANQIQAVQNQFKGLENDPERIVSGLEKLSSGVAMDFASGITSIAEGIQNAGQIASDSGLEFEQFGAIIAKTAEVTRQDGGQLGNTLKTTMARISRSQDADSEVSSEDRSNAAKAYKEVLGIDLFNSKGEYRDLSDTLDLLSDKWSSLTDAQKNYIAEESAGTRGMNVFKVMMDNYKDIQKLASDAVNDQDYYKDVQAKWEDSLAGKQAGLKASTQQMWNNLLSSGTMGGVIDMGTMGVNLVDGIMSKTKGFFDAITSNLIPSSEASNITSSALTAGLVGTLGMSATGFMSNLPEAMRSGQVGAVKDAFIQNFAPFAKVGKTATGLGKDLLTFGKAFVKSVSGATDANEELGESTEQPRIAMRGFSQSLKDTIRGQDSMKNLVKDFDNLKAVRQRIKEGASRKEALSTIQPNDITTTTGKIGLSLLKNKGLLTAGLGAAAIGGIITLINNQVEKTANKRQEIKDTALQTTQELEADTQNLGSLRSFVEQNRDEYARLIKGVDTRTNRNISLSDADYQKYLGIVQGISQYAPDMVERLDRYGNSIIKSVNGGTLDKVLEQSEKDLVQKTMDSMKVYTDAYDVENNRQGFFDQSDNRYGTLDERKRMFEWMSKLSKDEVNALFSSNLLGSLSSEHKKVLEDFYAQGFSSNFMDVENYLKSKTSANLGKLTDDEYLAYQRDMATAANELGNSQDAQTEVFRDIMKAVLADNRLNNEKDFRNVSDRDWQNLEAMIEYTPLEKIQDLLQQDPTGGTVQKYAQDWVEAMKTGGLDFREAMEDVQTIQYDPSYDNIKKLMTESIPTIAEARGMNSPEGIKTIIESLGLGDYQRTYEAGEKFLDDIEAGKYNKSPFKRLMSDSEIANDRDRRWNSGPTYEENKEQWAKQAAEETARAAKAVENAVRRDDAIANRNNVDDGGLSAQQKRAIANAEKRNDAVANRNNLTDVNAVIDSKAEKKQREALEKFQKASEQASKFGEGLQGVADIQSKQTERNAQRRNEAIANRNNVNDGDTLEAIATADRRWKQRAWDETSAKTNPYDNPQTWRGGFLPEYQQTAESNQRLRHYQENLDKWQSAQNERYPFDLTALNNAIKQSRDELFSGIPKGLATSLRDSFGKFVETTLAERNATGSGENFTALESGGKFQETQGSYDSHFGSKSQDLMQTILSTAKETELSIKRQRTEDTKQAEQEAFYRGLGVTNDKGYDFKKLEFNQPEMAQSMYQSIGGFVKAVENTRKGIENGQKVLEQKQVEGVENLRTQAARNRTDIPEEGVRYESQLAFDTYDIRRAQNWFKKNIADVALINKQAEGIENLRSQAIANRNNIADEGVWGRSNVYRDNESFNQTMEKTISDFAAEATKHMLQDFRTRQAEEKAQSQDNEALRRQAAQKRNNLPEEGVWQESKAYRGGKEFDDRMEDFIKGFEKAGKSGGEYAKRTEALRIQQQLSDNELETRRAIANRLNVNDGAEGTQLDFGLTNEEFNKQLKYVRENQGEGNSSSKHIDANTEQAAKEALAQRQAMESFISQNNINTSAQLAALERLASIYGLKDMDLIRSKYSIDDLSLAGHEEALSALKSNLAKVEDDLQAEYEAKNSARSATGMTPDQVTAMDEMFRNLDGYDYDKLFEGTALGVRMNAEELDRLSGAYKKFEAKKYQKEIDNLTQAWQDANRTIADSAEGSYEYNDAIQKRDMLGEQIQEARMLQSHFEGLVNPVQQYLTALQTAEEGDVYDTLSGDSGAKYVRENLYDKGLVGTEKFKKFAQMLTNEDLSGQDIAKYVETYESLVGNFENLFTEDPRDGIMRGIDQLRQAGLVQEKTDGNGDAYETILGDIEQISSALNLSDAAATAFMKKLSDFGINVPFTEEKDNLVDFRREAVEANNALSDIGKSFKIDMAETELEGIDGELEKIQKAKEEIGKAEMYPEKDQDLAHLKKIEDYYKNLKASKAEALYDASTDEGREAAEKKVNAYNERFQKTEEKGDMLNVEWDSKDADYFQEKIEQVSGELDHLRSEDGVIHIKTEGAEEATAVMKQLIHQKHEVGQTSEVMTRDLNSFSNTGTQGMLSGTRALGEAVQSYRELIDLKDNGFEVSSKQISDAWQGVVGKRNELTSYLQANDQLDSYQRMFGVDLSSNYGSLLNDIDKITGSDYSLQIMAELNGDEEVKAELDAMVNEAYNAKIQASVDEDGNYKTGALNRYMREAYGDAEVTKDFDYGTLDKNAIRGMDTAEIQVVAEFVADQGSLDQITTPAEKDIVCQYIQDSAAFQELDSGQQEIVLKYIQDPSSLTLEEIPEAVQLVNRILNVDESREECEEKIQDILRQIGLDESKISPEEMQQIVNRALGPDPSSIPPAPVTQTVNRVVIESGSKTSGGNIVSEMIHGTAHAQGTTSLGDRFRAAGHAFVNGTVEKPSLWNRIKSAGSAFARGSWGAPRTETALVGEVGTELKVDSRTGKWELLGQHGAQFANIHKNDIIFNSLQTAQLFKNGYVTANGGRGRLVGANHINGTANGSAYVKGSWSSGALTFYGGAAGYQPSSTNTNTNTAPAQQVQQAAEQAQEAVQNVAQEAQKEAENFFDWIEVRINRLTAQIENVRKKAESAFDSFENRHINFIADFSHTAIKIDNLNSAISRYREEAEKIELPEDYKNKIKNGLIDIENITDEDLAEKINKYKQWWEKSLEVEYQITDEQIRLAETLKAKFDLITTEFDAYVAKIQHTTDILETQLGMVEARGHFASKGFYESLVDAETQKANKLEEEYQRLIAQREEFLKTGTVVEGSEADESMLQTIREVELAWMAAHKSMLDYKNDWLQMDTDAFTWINDQVNLLTSETNFIKDLLNIGDNDLFIKDVGILSEKGKTTAALSATNYNVYMKQADEYKKKMKEINAALAKDPNNKNLIDTKNQYLKLQQEAIQNANEEKKAIISLIRDSYNRMVEALSKLIDKRKQLLQAEKNLYDYERNVTNQAKTITSLQKQLYALEGDDSEEAKAKRQQLSEQLKDAQDTLYDIEYSQWLADQENMMDYMLTTIEELLNARLDNTDMIIQEVIDYSNANADMIGSVIQESTSAVGWEVSDEIRNMWLNPDFDNILSFYYKGFEDQNTKLQTTVDGIYESLKKMVEQREAQISLANKNSSSSGTVKVGVVVGGGGTSGKYMTTSQKIQAGLIKYASGGYTGDEEGIAMLHKKERVLNAQQTMAFEKLVEDYLPSIKESMFVPKSKPAVPSMQSLTSESDVDITFNLPNVTDTKSFMREIQQSKEFESLVQHIAFDPLAKKSSLRKNLVKMK